MSMLGEQIKELRTLAGGLRKLYENGANLTRVQVAGMTTAVEVMREAADTIENLRGRLQDGGIVKGHEHWTRESQWANLFGTPERAARTLTHNAPSTCDECVLIDICDIGMPAKCMVDDYDALLEWLRGDVE